EIGPGGSLGALIRGAQCPPDRWPLILATLPAAADPRPDDAALTDALSRLWLLGVNVDWTEYQGRNTDATTAPLLPRPLPLPAPGVRDRGDRAGGGGGADGAAGWARGGGRGHGRGRGQGRSAATGVDGGADRGERRAARQGGAAGR